ncbi:hypothetical protein BCF33_1443 [Hasllibacter halocynthiae]|uniref:Uncharacterized protein n=1 Tax=Hasllibacter halocynthiae TaxID=595589 RepID=A0A2T0X0W2_9RHOB|nr:hypothetical protein BCF33_1443 [Hasllibacter halocynthiae]
MSGIDMDRVRPLYDQRTAEEHFDLVKRTIRVVELVDEAGRPDANLQAGLLPHLANEIVGQGLVHLRAAARRAEEIVTSWPRVDDEEATTVHEHGAHCETDRHMRRGRDFRRGVNLMSAVLRPMFG